MMKKQVKQRVFQFCVEQLILVFSCGSKNRCIVGNREADNWKRDETRKTVSEINHEMQSQALAYFTHF